jgi:transcriptional regulator with XRE-family HTH domain
VKRMRPKTVVSKKVPDSNDKEVGRRIAVRRRMCRMSQTALAEHLGITFQQVQKYENGKNRVGAGRLQRIAEVLNVPVSSFFGEGASATTPAVIEFLDTANSVRLLQAYSGIKDPRLQKSILELVEGIAGKDGGTGRRAA